MEIKIVVAAHKEASMPESPIFLPIHVGADLHSFSLPYQPDNTGEHISEKNPSFCELTALYWAWKNLSADYIGLCHYRRFFAERKLWKKRILSQEKAYHLCENNDIILPKPRNYWIETNYTQYIHAHNPEPLALTRVILSECFPESSGYLTAFDQVMNRTWGHRFNMLLMRKEVLNAYCSWLFSILFELEKRLDISSYDSYNARVFGFIGERLLDVWMLANQKKYCELPYLFIGSENWPVKIYRFIRRKFSKSAL